MGFETVRLLRANRGKFEARLGGGLELRWVCDLAPGPKARKLGLPKRVRRTRDFKRVLADPDVDVVVELFGGLRHARGLVLGALAAGKHVVTANKHLLSMQWNEILGEARRRGLHVYYEASVAGAIPIIKALRSGLAANRISSVFGILNGTTNYVLTKMAHDGSALADAVREAQRLGMAERDPTLDLNGTDTLHKVSILASLLTGTWIDPKRVPRQGIEGVEADDVRFAVDRLDRTARLIGTVSIDWDSKPVRVETHVQPTLIPVKHPLAAVHGGYNAVLVKASAAEDLMFYGKGAGPGPAASAVLADVLALSQDILSEARPHGGKTRGPRIRLAEESPAPYYIKLRVRDVPGALGRITGILGKCGISIARIHQRGGGHYSSSRRPRGGRASDGVPVMLVTHETSRSRVDKALKRITALGTVAARRSLLRILPGGPAI